MSRQIEFPVARVFKPLLEPARHKGAYGGRGSGKSWFFADRLIEDSLYERGLLSACIREVQVTLKDSAKRLLEKRLAFFGLGQADGFKVYEHQIKTPGDGVIIFKGMKDYNAEGIKSLEGFKRAWVEEAQSLSARSLSVLRPTLREPGSEMWFSWNPRRKSDAVDTFLRGGAKPEDALVVEALWSHNPWFSPDLELERQYDLKYSPSYRHIWEGDYATVVQGAYYATHLETARQEGRVTDLAYDPMLARYAYWDIGIGDAMAIWIAQRKGQMLYLMDYIEGVGQGLDYYVGELRSRGHDSAECVLPHDGANRSAVTGKTFEDHLKEAGFRTRVRKNGGAGAAMMRIEATRRIFPRIWFNDKTTAPGREAVGAYHEKWDANRNIGLGPDHDWSSHANDALGLCCLDYDEPRPNVRRIEQPRPMGGGGGNAWLGG